MRNSEAPEGFTSEMDNIKSSFTNLEARINTKFAAIETRLDMLEYRFDELDYIYLCLFNYQRRMSAYEAISVPFLDREVNQEELPPILSVENIDRLTKEECQSYLKGYKVQFHPNETVKLKERLRDAIGLMAGHDLNYRFSTFSQR